MSLINLKPYADLISILGAGIIFFSWIVSNTLHQNYQATKSGIERAQSDRRLYLELDAARRSIEGLAGELLNIRGALDSLRGELANKPSSQQSDDLRLSQLKLSVSSKEINARQIDWAQRFCATEIYLSLLLESDSESTRELKLACDEVSSLLAKKEALFREIHGLIAPSSSLDKGTEARFSEFLRIYNEIPQRFSLALPRVVEASNCLQKEAGERLTNLKRRVELVSAVALLSYVLGTALALFGKVVEKLA